MRKVRRLRTKSNDNKMMMEEMEEMEKTKYE